MVGPGQRDITGQKFGKLTALYPTEGRKYSGSVIWHCKCDCGGEVDAPLKQLTSGYRKSCGCLSHPPLKDYVGKRFGSLTVLEYAGKRNGMHRWRCKCDCGEETVVGQSLLQSGKTKSCGCLQKQVYADNLKLVDGTSVTILESIQRNRESQNSSGYKGVYREAQSGKWTAQIMFKRKTYHLGRFTRLEDAIKARQQGERIHTEFLEWYYEQHPEKANMEMDADGRQN